MRRQRLVVAVAILVSAAACSPARGGPTSSEVATRAGQTSASGVAVELTIYAAASLKDALAEIERAYEAAVPGTTLTVATDSSSTLRTQIEQGAPADVFLSADQTNPGVLVDGGLADGDIVNFARNRLTIIVPADNPAGVESPEDLARSGVKVVAAGDEVPITRYTRQAVTTLAAQPGYPADYVGAYAANIVSKEENVKAMVAKIELGEGDAAIVYVTDAMAASGVATIEIPAAANVAATYAGVVVDGSARPTLAHAFLAWLTGPDGAAILEAFGFQRPT